MFIIFILHAQAARLKGKTGWLLSTGSEVQQSDVLLDSTIPYWFTLSIPRVFYRVIRLIMINILDSC